MNHKARINLLVTSAAALMVGTGAAHAGIIAQTATDGNSGKKNFGQQILLDSSNPEFDDFPVYTLDDVSFWAAQNGDFTDEQTVYIDVYTQGTRIGDPEFNPADTVDIAGLTYLGSSSNAVDYTTGSSSGTKVTWTFSGINIPVDEFVYLVFSGDAVSGDFESGAFNNHSATGPGLVLVGISEANSNPLFGGNPNTSETQDNRYEANFTGVPEPSSLALLAAGGLLLAKRRRAL